MKQELVLWQAYKRIEIRLQGVLPLPIPVSSSVLATEGSTSDVQEFGLICPAASCIPVSSRSEQLQFQAHAGHHRSR